MSIFKVTYKKKYPERLDEVSKYLKRGKISKDEAIDEAVKCFVYTGINITEFHHSIMARVLEYNKKSKNIQSLMNNVVNGISNDRLDRIEIELHESIIQSINDLIPIKNLYHLSLWNTIVYIEYFMGFGDHFKTPYHLSDEDFGIVKGEIVKRVVSHPEMIDLLEETEFTYYGTDSTDEPLKKAIKRIKDNPEEMIGLYLDYTKRLKEAIDIDNDTNKIFTDDKLFTKEGFLIDTDGSLMEPDCMSLLKPLDYSAYHQYLSSHHLSKVYNG